MEIQSINKKYSCNTTNSQYKTNNNLKLNPSSLRYGTNSIKNNLAFGQHYEDVIMITTIGKKVLKSTRDELRDIAEQVCEFSCSELENITYIKFIFEKKKESKAAYERLQEEVNQVRRNKNTLENNINVLEVKKALGISNLTEQKTRLNREFISLIVAEKEGKEPPIKNGILVHGTSSNKEGFVNWLTESAGVVVKSIQHDTNRPTRTIDTLIDIAENAERSFNHSRIRTLVVVKDLDKMLINTNSSEAMDNINEFKSIAEDLSKKYHTTIITSTDELLNLFEPATIASNRLGIHVDLKDGISEAELKELSSMKAEVARLNCKAKNYARDFTTKENALVADEEDYDYNYRNITL